MKVDVILGLQWGDEGKGKIVDAMTPHYDIIARFQGGPNAGHTIEFNGNKIVLHSVPSGILRDNTVNVIGNGVVVDPVILISELKNVTSYNPDAAKNLRISNRAHLILPIHRALDACFEQAKGKEKIGSTLKGIAPAYSDKYNRRGLRAGEIMQDNFSEKFRTLTKEQMKIIDMYEFNIDNFQIDKLPYKEYEQQWLEAIEQMKKLQYIDAEIYLNQSLQSGKSVLAEGAQGTLLDIDFGSYPFVTSSNTICAGVCSGLGIPPSKIGKVFGVFKAYCTRVGSGPFPTELFDDTGNKLQALGHEFGATTGRARRCGWLDLPALNYAVMINGVTDLVMTKADILSTFDIIKVAPSYNNHTLDYLPFTINTAPITPDYTELPGWNVPVDKLQSIKEVPEELSSYIKFIENYVHVPVSFLSLGPDRKQTYQL